MATVEPKISVVLPVYNGAQTIARAVDSILFQTMRDFELILIDDGSSDGTLPILKRFASRDERVRLVSRENRGLIRSLNEGIAASRGQFIARMDADDISYPQRFSKQIEALESDRSLMMVASHVDYLVTPSRKLTVKPFVAEKRAGKAATLFDPYFIHPTVMYRRTLFDDASFLYRQQYKHAEDFDMYRRIAREHDLLLLPDALLAQGILPDGLSQTNRDAQMLMHIRIVVENLKHYRIFETAAPVEELGSFLEDANSSERWLVSLLQHSGRGISAFESCADAYYFGLRRFVNLLFMWMSRRNGARRARDAIAAAGLEELLDQRSRLILQTSRIMPIEFARSVEKRAVRSWQLLRSDVFEIG